MHVVIVYNGSIPVATYGGTGRDIWYEGRELVKAGHRVTYLVGKNSLCPFADVIPYDPKRALDTQIPESADILHLHEHPRETPKKACIVTIHGNTNDTEKEYHINTVFVSKNHAARHGSDQYVYNGMDWADYPTPDLKHKRDRLHFLGKAAWRIKNLKACIKIARCSKYPLEVMGGYRFNFKMGMRFTLDPRIHFHGFVNNKEKAAVMQDSAGLLFPVLWHEPMGLAIIESLYYGCPVFGTPYGALPELVSDEMGFLSDSLEDLCKAVASANNYDKKSCHEYARDCFNSTVMTQKYIALFEKVLNGHNLNEKAPRLLQAQEEKLLPFNF